MKKYTVFLPLSKGPHSDQLSDCLSQLEEYILANKDRYKLLRLTVFLDVASDDELQKLEQEFYWCIKNKIAQQSFVISIIPQPPAESLVCLEALFAISSDIFRAELKTHGNREYIMISDEFGQEFISCGIRNNQAGSFGDSAESVLAKLKALLNAENFSLSDIIRQWNYIENIFDIKEENGTCSQNYQIFNDVRSAFYSSDKWSNGYPAATGIGINTGCVITDAIALRPAVDCSILPLHSPRQIDAHQYPENLLQGSASDGTKTTPKFERAKIIAKGNQAEIYISGTAAIQGGISSSATTAGEQTKETLDNIMALVAKDNVAKALGSDAEPDVKIDYLRVYVKRKDDFSSVMKVCESYFPSMPILYVRADVCRSELLVEIEGYATAFFGRL